MMRVDEQEIDVLLLLFPLARVGTSDQDVQHVEEVDQDGVVELLQFPLVVVVLGVEAPDALALEGPDDWVVGVVLGPEHCVGFHVALGRGGGPPFLDVLVCVEVDILEGWEGERADVGRFRHFVPRNLAGFLAVPRLEKAAHFLKPKNKIFGYILK